jgi:hypothetical protein
LYIGFFKGAMSAALLLKNASFVMRASSDGIAAVLDCKILGPGTVEEGLASEVFLNEALHPMIDESKSPDKSSIQDRLESNIRPSLCESLPQGRNAMKRPEKALVESSLFPLFRMERSSTS